MISQRSNLFPTLFDLIYAYRNGTRTLFYKLLSQALKFHQVDLDLNKRKELGRIFYKRLTDFCIFESNKTESSIKWVVNQNSLIEVEKNEFLILGTTRYVEDVSKKFPHLLKRHHQIYKYEISESVIFEIELPVMELSLDLQRRVSALGDAEIISNNYRSHWTYCPDIDTARSTLFEKSAPEMLLGEYDIEKFDFERLTWDSDCNKSEPAIGYFRIRDKFGSQAYLVVFYSGSILKALQTRYFDWGYLIAASELGAPFDLSYSKENHILAVPVKLFSFLPVLLRRSLLLQSFKWPEVNNYNYCFNGISKEQIHYLESSYPCLRINLQ